MPGQGWVHPAIVACSLFTQRQRLRLTGRTCRWSRARNLKASDLPHGMESSFKAVGASGRAEQAPTLCQTYASLPLFGRPDVPESAEQGEVVHDLQHPAGNQRQVLVPCCKERPGQRRARRSGQAARDGREARRCGPLCRCHDGHNVGGAGTQSGRAGVPEARIMAQTGYRSLPVLRGYSGAVPILLVVQQGRSGCSRTRQQRHGGGVALSGQLARLNIRRRQRPRKGNPQTAPCWSGTPQHRRPRCAPWPGEGPPSIPRRRNPRGRSR